MNIEYEISNLKNKIDELESTIGWLRLKLLIIIIILVIML